MGSSEWGKIIDFGPDITKVVRDLILLQVTGKKKQRERRLCPGCERQLNEGKFFGLSLFRQ